MSGTAGLAFGLVGGADVGHQRFDELLEVATEGMFGGVAEFVALSDAGDVLFYGHKSKDQYRNFI